MSETPASASAVGRLPGPPAVRSSRRCVRDAPHGKIAGRDPGGAGPSRRVGPAPVAPAHFRRGERLLRQGLREPVIAAFWKAVEIDPESARASFHLGLAMRAAGPQVLDAPV